MDFQTSRQHESTLTVHLKHKNSSNANQLSETAIEFVHCWSLKSRQLRQLYGEQAQFAAFYRSVGSYRNILILQTKEQQSVWSRFVLGFLLYIFSAFSFEAKLYFFFFGHSLLVVFVFVYSCVFSGCYHLFILCMILFAKLDIYISLFGIDVAWLSDIHRRGLLYSKYGNRRCKPRG